MALPVNVDDILLGQEVENQTIEYKSGWDIEPVLHSICAFANDYEGYCGGCIFIGVEAHDGIPVLPIKGLDKGDVDRIQGEILEYCKKCISPSYCPSIQVVKHEQATLIVLWCHNGYDEPYYAKEHIYAKDSKEKKCYIRLGSSTSVATSRQIQELRERSEVVPFDDRVNVNASITDIMPSLLKEFLSGINSYLYKDFENIGLEKICESLRLLYGPKGYIHPKNVALLMFNDRPDRFIPYSFITVDYVPDPTGEGMITKDFVGPIYRQINDCLLYIKNNFIETKIHKIDGQAESVSLENYPYAALEEIVPNAVLHKDYRIPEPITIRVTLDKIEVTSFPGLSSSITNERVKKLDLVSHSYRNKRIAEFLRDMDLIEAKNTGIPKAIKALRINGSPDLSIEMDQNREYVSVTIWKHHDFVFQSVPVESFKVTVADRIVAFLKLHPNSTGTQIYQGLGYKSRPNSLNKALANLIDEKRVAVKNRKYSNLKAD